MEYGVLHPTHVPYLGQFWRGGIGKQTQEAFASVDEIQGIGMKARPLYHKWAVSPISVISDIGLSLISELPISD